MAAWSVQIAGGVRAAALNGKTWSCFSVRGLDCRIPHRWWSSAPSSAQEDAAVEGALVADDKSLLKECTVELKRGSGPGGQHRNKIESYVTLRHRPTGLSGQCGEHRKQELNLGEALERLRGALAYSVAEGCRAVVSTEGSGRRVHSAATGSAVAALLKVGSDQRIGTNNARYPLAVWRLLVELRERQGILSDTAASLGTSTGQLNRVFAKDKRLLAAANTLRARHGLARLVIRS